MANNFIKWWKTKIVNGYKQLSGSNGYSSSRMSDTEKLLGSDLGLGSNDVSCSTPPNPAHDTELQSVLNREKDKINIEKISRVSVESGYDQNRQERQEFSFTLYDFDGHGKITKDDITGLVTTIYETLKSCVQVPYYGSKTIKVQLIISPNQKTAGPNSSLDEKCTDEPKINVRHHHKQDLNKHSHRKSDHCRHEKKSEPEQSCCNLACPAVSCATQCSRASQHEPKSHHACYQNKQPSTCAAKPSPKYSSAQSIHQRGSLRNTQSRRASLCPVFCTKTWRSKNRSSSLQRQELLEIIQANMDKNNCRFQTSKRKQIHKNPSYLPQMSVSDYENQDEKLSPQSTLNFNDIASMMSSQNYLSKLKLPYSNYDKLLNALGSMSNTNPFHRSALTQQHCKCPRHYKLKTNQASNSNSNSSSTRRVTSNKRNNYYTNDFTKRSRSIERVHSRSKVYDARFEQSVTAKKHSKKFSRLLLSHSNSPHYLKHQNRQEDQARAMAQVVRWLEKEVSTNVTIKSRLEKKLNKSKSCYTSERKSPVNFKVINPNSKCIQRHKHHHVHEYIHHHYHHF